MKKSILGFACTLSHGGPRPNLTSTTDGVTQSTQTTITERMGTITEHTPGASIVLSTNTGAPVH